MATKISLPSTRALLTSLITTLATSTQQPSVDQTEPSATSNPLSHANPNTKSILLTLHTLFPNDLLPALDLLDHGLVTRFILSEFKQKTIVYQVRTAQKPSSRSHAYSNALGTSYEVHLTAWSCSCPAFAFAAFPAAGTDQGAGEGDEDAEGWKFGGLTRGDDVPACKHLLACVIAERCRGFAGLVEVTEVGREEVAGWAAGWGD
jgi:hypothetical protein